MQLIMKLQIHETRLKRETNESTITAEDYNNPFSVTDETSRQKISEM